MNGSPPPSRSPLRSAAPIVLSIVFLLVAGLVVWRSSTPTPTPTPTATPTPAPTATPAPAPAPALSACGPLADDRVAIGDGVLKLGSIFPLTGAEAGTTGAPLVAATQMAVEEVNGAGGIPGLRSPKLEIVGSLDEGDPGTPTTCESASRLLAGGADVIAGPYASTDTLAIYQRVTQAGRLMVSPSNTLTDLSTVPDNGLYFRTVVSDRLQADALADLVAQEGRRNVAVIADEDSFAIGVARPLTEQLKSTGVATTLLTYPDPSAFPGIAGKVAAGPYDSVVFIGFRDIADLAGMLLNRGLNPQNRGFYGSTGFMQNTSAREATPGALERLAGLRGFVPWALPDFNERLKAYYRKQSGRELEDATYGAQEYDAVIAVALAAAAARTDDPGRIADELPQVTRGGQKCTTYQACVGLLRKNPAADIDYDGVSGPLGFTAQGDVCQGLYNLSAFGRTGYLDQPIRGGLFSPDECR